MKRVLFLFINLKITSKSKTPPNVKMSFAQVKKKQDTSRLRNIYRFIIFTFFNFNISTVFLNESIFGASTSSGFNKLSRFCWKVSSDFSLFVSEFWFSFSKLSSGSVISIWTSEISQIKVFCKSFGDDATGKDDSVSKTVWSSCDWSSAICSSKGFQIYILY